MPLNCVRRHCSYNYHIWTVVCSLPSLAALTVGCSLPPLAAFPVLLQVRSSINTQFTQGLRTPVWLLLLDSHALYQKANVITVSTCCIYIQNVLSALSASSNSLMKGNICIYSVILQKVRNSTFRYEQRSSYNVRHKLLQPHNIHKESYHTQL